MPVLLKEKPVARRRKYSKTVCSFDTETTGLDGHRDEMFAFSIGHQSGKIEVWRVDGKDGNDPEEAWDRLLGFFQDTTTAKVCHQSKFDYLMAKRALKKKFNFDIPRNTEWHDTLIMSQLLRNKAAHGLDVLCYELCGFPTKLDHEIGLLGRQLGGYQHIPVHKMKKYQRNDAERCMLLWLTFVEDISSDDALWADYRNEIALIHTTIRMEEHGILVHETNCHKLIEWMESELEQVQKETRLRYGEYINWNSDEQVARVLFKQMGLPVLAYTEKQKPSTDKDVLQKLKEKYPDPVYDLIMRQRSYKTGISMIKSYLELRHPDGRLRTNLKTNHAQTGRQSSEKPNLQNVAKEAALKNPFPVPARRCFRAEKRHILKFVDYSGIEMRLIVAACGEEEAIQILKDGGDIHAVAAEVVLGDRWKHATDEQKAIWRSAVKNATFGIAYGAGLAKFALTLGLSLVEAKPGFERYKKRFPKIANFNREIAKLVKKQGYIVTAFGRRLEVSTTEAFVGANYRIQGDAAGIMKRAEVRVDEYLEKNWGDKVRMVLTIHDELIFSFHRSVLKHKDEICYEIAKLMTDMPEIAAPLEVEWKKSITTWDAAKKFKPQYRMAA